MSNNGYTVIEVDNGAKWDVKLVDGSEQDDSKTTTINRITEYKASKKAEGVPWRDVVRKFLVAGSAASDALASAANFEEWVKAYKTIDESTNPDCTNYFGELVRAISIRSTPFKIGGAIRIYNEKLLEAATNAVKKSVGAAAMDERMKAVLELVLEVVARDQVSSAVYPARDYQSTIKFGEATRGDLLSYYNNLAKSNEKELSLSCTNGEFDTRWHKKSSKAKAQTTTEKYEKLFEAKTNNKTINKTEKVFEKRKFSGKCDNCNVSGHSASQCSKPRDQSMINKNKLARSSGASDTGAAKDRNKKS